MELGVCYYPEHWEPVRWAQDAQAMSDLGIRWVRIAEFAWSRIEPTPGRFDWAWLDQAVETLAAAGLKIVMCTPTATPPKWLVDQMPDLVALDEMGRPRGFGSRRHYCFSHPGYRAQSRRISQAVVERYGRHPAVQAWQTDNEYGCHFTVLSYSVAACQGFRSWLQQRYGSIKALNQAWGTVFWSQEYRSFDEIDLPNLTVTEANPSHRLDFRRYSSDQVVEFNREQVQIIREGSPGRTVLHNYMGFFTEFDHYDVSRDLDAVSWDSYPIGFTQMFFFADKEKNQWAYSGHPDVPSFHHDLYRGQKSNGRWWVMEQQPGPVNWAHWNPAPAPGVVRLWTWQALAHGAEVVSYFRWRQAPFAQEQMHAGLNRPDGVLDRGGEEAGRVARELKALQQQFGVPPQRSKSCVAMVFDYASLWMMQIQPQGQDYNPLELAFRLYEACRACGLDVDIVGPETKLSPYRLVLLPLQTHVSAQLAQALRACSAQILCMPRTASKTLDLQIPETLAPSALQHELGIRVARVSSMSPGIQLQAQLCDHPVVVSRWFEDLECSEQTTVRARLSDGRPLWTRNGRWQYVSGWLDGDGLQRLVRTIAQEQQLPLLDLPEGIRVSRHGTWLVVQNFKDQPQEWRPEGDAALLLGQAQLAAHDVAIWQIDQTAAAPHAA